MRPRRQVRQLETGADACDQHRMQTTAKIDALNFIESFPSSPLLSVGVMSRIERNLAAFCFYFSGVSWSTVNELPSISYWNFAPTAASLRSTGATFLGSASEFSASRSFYAMLEATPEYREVPAPA